MNKTALRVMAMSATLTISATVHAGALGNFQEMLVASYAAEANRNIPGAIEALRNVDSAMKETYLYNLRMGWLDYLAGKFEASAGYYRLAAGLHPNALEPLQGELLPLAAAGRTTELLKTHESILKIDPNNYKSLSQLAWLHYQTKNYKSAASFYSRVLRLFPTDSEMLIGLGYCLKNDGNTAAAVKAFKTVLLLSPDDTRALEGLKKKSIRP